MAIASGLSVISAEYPQGWCSADSRPPRPGSVLPVLPMGCYIGPRFVQMNMLVYMIHPGNRDEVMVLTVR